MATWLKPSSLPSSCGGQVGEDAGPWPGCTRLSFGAMNMSGPPPAATSVFQPLKMSANGCSTMLILRSLLAARICADGLLEGAGLAAAGAVAVPDGELAAERRLGRGHALGSHALGGHALGSGGGRGRGGRGGGRGRGGRRAAARRGEDGRAREEGGEPNLGAHVCVDLLQETNLVAYIGRPAVPVASGRVRPWGREVGTRRATIVCHNGRDMPGELSVRTPPPRLSFGPGPPPAADAAPAPSSRG